MVTDTKARELIDRLFEEEALAIGGLVAIHELDDALVRRLFQTLGVIRKRTLRRLRQNASTPESAGTTPHPAIEEFLASLRGQ